MDQILKFFPFMPEAKDTGKLIIAILIYFLGVPAVVFVVSFILGLTVILAPVAFIIGSVASLYSMAGVIFAILCYCGVDLSAKSE